MQFGTYPLKRRGSHPGHGPTRSDSRPAHTFQYVPAQPRQAQPVSQMSPYGPEFLPVSPTTPMFPHNNLPPGQGGAYPGAPGYVPAPMPGLAYQPAPPLAGPSHPQGHPQGLHRPAPGAPWPSNPAYGAPPPWWGFRPGQPAQPEQSLSSSDFAPSVHPLFNVESKDQLIHELEGHSIKIPSDWQSFSLMVLHPSSNPKQSRNPHTRAFIAESAIDPPVQKLRLVSPHLPWPIDVLPSPAKSPSKKKADHEAFVTVGDVLTALHRSLHTRITEGEYFIGSEKDRERINASYREATRKNQREKEDGVKRVDFLGDRNICVGFRLPESEREEKWIKERLVTGGGLKPEDVWILELEEPEDED